MTRIFTDAGQTVFQQSNMDKVYYGSGYASEPMSSFSLHIYYTGAAWAVSTTRGSHVAAADVSVAWNGTDNRLDVDLSGMSGAGFSWWPIVTATPVASTTHAGGVVYHPEVRVTSTTDFYIRFVDLTGPSYVTTESADMDVYVRVDGAIA